MKLPFQVELSAAAQRNLKALETIRAEIVNALLELENEPDKGPGGRSWFETGTNDNLLNHLFSSTILFLINFIIFLIISRF